MKHCTFSFRKIILAFACVFAVGQAFGLTTTKIDGKTYYKIQSCTDLKDFSGLVNGGSLSANAILTQNIDCNGITTTSAPLIPIGQDASKIYQGTFDGAGYTINKVIVQMGEGSDQYAGLIGYLGADGLVQNVVLYNLSVKASTKSGADDYVGGIAGKTAGTIKTCTVTGDATIEGRRMVGGITGYATKTALIENSLCTAKINAMGSADYDQSSKSATYVGGIVGRGEHGTRVFSCVYSGNTITRIETDESGQPENASNVFPIAGGPVTLDECYFDGVNISGEAGSCGNNNNETGSCSLGYNKTSCEEFKGTWTNASSNTTAPKCTIGGVDVFGNKTNCESKGGDWLISACGKGTKNLRDPELICKLNKGNFIGGECYNGTEIWSDEEQLTNQSGVNSSGEGTSYAILFDPNGGAFDGGRTTPDTVRVNADEPISAPEAVPSRVGDEFLGWAKEYNATTPTAFGNAVGAMTFYAVWKNSVVITFDANGGEFPNNPVTNKRVAKNHAIDTVGISVPSARGATFLGWSRNKNATVADETLGSSSDPVTFYAVYSGSYKVSFNSNGGSFPNGATREKTVSFGADFTAEGITQPNPPSSVYTFAGWSLDQNADASEAISSSSAVIGTMYVSEITVYAVWSAKTWTITFDPNGGYFDNQNNTTGKAAKTKIFIDGEKINSNGISTTNPPVKKSGGGSTVFLGWARSADPSKVLPDLGSATKDETFKAVWGSGTYYTVTFDVNGFGSIPEDQRVKKTDGRVAPPTVVPPAGATFEGWYTEAACTNKFNFDNAVSKDTTLYAKWTVNSHTINYRIYDKASGEEFKDEAYSETVPYGTKVSVTTKIVPGFNYTAWQSESDNVIFADDGSFVMPDNDVELYCFRSTGVYTLTWDLKGGEYASYDGEYSPAGQYNFGETIYAPILKRDGYTFEGWTLDGELLVDFPREMPSTNTKFYAKWKENGPYKLTIQVVGAPANVPIYPDGVQGGTSVTLTVPDFTPSGLGALYHFLGWEENYSDIEISSSNTFTMPDHDVRIIAKFVQKPVILYTKGECSTCTGDDTQIIKEYGASYTIKGSSDKVFSRTGYEHKGWSTDENGLAVEYAFGATYTGNDNLTLYPVWEAVTLKLVWNFTLPEGWNADDVSYGEFPVGSYSYDTQLDKPTVSKFGYDVDWYTTSACAANPAGTGCTAWNFDEGRLVGSQGETITLYGHVVKRTLTVTYHLLNEAGGSDAVPSFKKEYTIDDLYDGKFLYYNINENTVIPEDRIYVDGYGYVVWYRTRNCENMALYEKISNNSDFSAAVELYGLVDGYKITYHAGTGATGDDVVRKKTYGEDYTLEGAGLFTRDNYTQVGWARTDGGAKALDLGATYNVDVGMGSGLDLYPVWELTSYTITYMDENDVISADLLNENTPATFTVESSDIALVDAKTKIEDGAEESGYIFEGWYSEPEFETKVEMIPAGSHENVVLYAKYIRAYKITYFLDGAPSDVWLLPGAAVEPSMPTEAGFTFSGWNVWYRYVDNTIDSIPQPTEMPEYNVVAEGFLKSRVTVSFDANGGVFGDDQTTPYSKYVTKSVVITDEGVPMISKAGSQFMGWASSAESMEPVTSFGVANVEDVTFYAIWKPIVTITVAANESKPYNGEAQTITVTWTGLPDGYSVVCDASLTNVSEGLKTITCDKIVDGNGTDVTDNYYSVFTDDRTTGSFSIEKASPTVVVSLDDWTCAGEPSTPSVTPEYISAESVTYVYAKTDADTMVVANWSSDVPSNAGDYYVKAIVAGTDNYDGGSATAEFKIDTKSSAGLVVTFSPESATYTGNDQTPTVVVKDGDNTLTLDKDYMVAWNATPNAAGTYTATVTYIGDYSGTKIAEFTVAAKSVSDIVVTVTPPNFVYTGSALTPVVTVKDGDNALTFGTDYTVSGLDNVIGVGSYEVTISGTGNYNGTATATFTVSPVITMNLGDGETLECSAGAKGAAVCNETQDNIVHVYGSATAELPDAVKSGWTFVGWYDNAKFENAAVESIAADRDDALSLYPKFEKAITVVYGTSAEDVLDVTIDSDDSADDIEAKIETAVKEALDGKLPEKGTTDEDPYSYEFDKFVKNSETGVYEPSFKSIPKEYTIVYNLPEGASSSSSYTYSETEDFTLATDIKVTDWTFSAWYDNAEHTGDAVTKIVKGTFGDKEFFALYTQDITVTIGEKTFPVTIVSDDDADDINEKILAEAHNQGIEDPTKTDPDGKITYEFEKYNCTAGVSGYSCENVFTKTYTEYTVSVVLPEGATLDCVEGHNGAVNCTDDGAGIKHTYGDETRPLPGAVKEGWEFAGWYDNADGIDDGVNNHLIDAIGASEFGEDIKIYALFAKELTVTLSTDPDVSVKIALDNNDNADSVSKKVNEAYGKLTPKPAAPTKDSDDKYDYTFKEFVCEGSAESYACSAEFTPTGREFKVAVNLLDSIWLVCKISNGCAKDASGKDYVKHNYGTETLLPEARIIDSEGEIIRDWEFKGWFENEDGLGDAVKTIDKEVAKDTTLYPFFTKKIKVSLDVTKPATVIDVVIDNNDNADSVSAKVTKAAAEHVPPIEPTPKHIEEAPKLIDFAGYECEFKTDAYVCKAVYDTTGMTYEVAVNLPDNAHLVCTEGAVGAENCTEDGSAIKHTYGTDTKPLPGAVMTDKLGEVDDSWNFVGWFDNKDGIDDASLPDDKGNKVESINAEAYGSDLEIFPYFEKVIHVVLSEDPLQEVDVAIDNNDDADSVSAKVTKAAEDNGFEKPKKDSDGKYDYFFSSYECTEVNDNYECEASFDRTPIVFEVAVNLPANAKLICDAGAKGAENCAEYGTAIYHTYGIETTPLPDVAIVDGKGIVDESWKFEGWFDNKDGIDDGANGNKVTSIVADATNGESIYPYLTKTIVAKIGDETVEVVIDNNDTKDSINAKVTEAAENRNPPIPTPKKDKDGEYEYEFTGYECDADFVCEATFDGKPYDIDIVVAYGDGSDDTLEVTISSTDTDADIEKKIEDAMKNHVPEIPLPTKDEDAKYTYEFDKFEKNPQTGRFEPTFNSKAKIFQVSFNLPKSGKLTREFKGYVYGERTELPEARIENDGEWVFKGWYTKKNGAGVRVKVILETEMGELSFYPLFQKTIKYDARGNKGEIIVIYEDDPTKTIERALNGVIPMDYQEKGKTYTFDKWVLKNSVYTATFTEKTSVIEVAKPSFGVNVSGHTLEINGAPMNARVAVFNMSGRMVAQGIVENGTQRVELTTPGSYVVRVNSQVVRVNVK